MEERRTQELKLEKKHPLAIRWFHWVNFPLIAIMVWSGLCIYWANDVYRIGWGDFTLVHFFPDWVYKTFSISGRLAEGMAWHFTFMWLFLLNGLAYVAYLFISRQRKHLFPTKGTLKEALQVVLHDLKFRKEPLPRKKFNGAQQIAYTSVILMGSGSLVTGVAIYKPVQFGWLTWLCGGYQFARLLHFVLTLAFCLFFLVHVAQVARAGWNNFRSMVTGYEVAPAEEERAS